MLAGAFFVGVNNNNNSDFHVSKYLEKHQREERKRRREGGLQDLPSKI